MTPTEAEVEAFARKLAAEAGWERYVDTGRRTLEALPTDAPVTDTLPAEAIEAGARAITPDLWHPRWDHKIVMQGERERVRAKVRAVLLAALPHIRGAASPSPTSGPDGQEAVFYSLDIDGEGMMEVMRDVTKEECRWLDGTVKAGTVVYQYHGPTYGCIGPQGVAVTYEPNVTPFLELPRAALRKMGAGR